MRISDWSSDVCSSDLKFRLYFYLTRYLLERVSWLCRDHRRANEGDGTAEVIFSNRSYMSYDAMRTYLCRLRDHADTRIDWSAFDPSAIRAVNHEKMIDRKSTRLNSSH